MQQYSQSGAKKGPYGSGDAEDGYTLLFENMEAFQAWRQREEEEKMVEFVKGDTHGSKAVPPRFKDHTKLVCARHSRSGRKKYVKKFPDRVRKVPSRKVRVYFVAPNGQGWLIREDLSSWTEQGAQHLSAIRLTLTLIKSVRAVSHQLGSMRFQ